ncbi:MAG: hypothetical protein RL689_1860, partial [Planctomycetota bacterium]
PFLNWAGKAERVSFDVPTLPLFVHERLSTKVILDSVKGHHKDRSVKTGGVGQMGFADLFGVPEVQVTDQLLRAYEHPDKWTNRLILGDSLVVMNSLLKYEGLGGGVQMIYMDPPYGVKFGSNFQPFVRKRDVKHNDDEDMTREPEMVKAYRDTWELGLHSYLTYLRDRLLTARDLLAPSGSIFVQISDENVHHIRELMDEVFGTESFCRIISIAKTSGFGSELVPVTRDYILWYARDRERVKFRQVFREKLDDDDDPGMYKLADPDGRIYRIDNLTGQFSNTPSCIFEYEFNGRRFTTPATRQWKTNREGMNALAQAGRLVASGGGLYYKRYLDDFPVRPVTDAWGDTSSGGFTEAKYYVVQTNVKVVQRCMLMTTDPGDLVLDPTCGSGTTAYVAEEWGRRWITIDTSRVPLALARQRLLTATFPYYSLKDESRGPAGGFVYVRKQNKKGEEVGGIVPHITLKSIANNEPPEEEVLVDRPESEPRTGKGAVVRITGPFTVEGTIPTPQDMAAASSDGVTEARSDELGGAENYGSFVDRMLEVLRRSPVLHLGGNKSVTLRNVRKPAKTLSLGAEAIADDFSHVGVPPKQGHLSDEARQKPVALVFGPENGAVGDRLVYEAAIEARAKQYGHLYVVGFAITPTARKTVEQAEAALGIAATYIQATPDLMMGDLLKTMRSSQIFSVCGLPDVVLRKVKDAKAEKGGAPSYEVELRGLDTFDPATMKTEPMRGEDVPCWMLDTDYNGLCFRARQVFFPRTGAWDDLKKTLKADFAATVWDHLAGTSSTPFEMGEHKRIAVKVIDDRGNELLVVKGEKEAV